MQDLPIIVHLVGENMLQEALLDPLARQAVAEVKSKKIMCENKNIEIVQRMYKSDNCYAPADLISFVNKFFVTYDSERHFSCLNELTEEEYLKIKSNQDQ